MNDSGTTKMTRRQALRTAGAAGIYLGTANAFGRPADPSGAKRKIKLGIVGCGGRGGWLAKLFKEHGGYEIHAVADYFQRVADKCGDEVGVNSKRRFSGLSGHRKLIESGVEAIALETPPYFLPGYAEAAVEAGLHVYMAKPVAVDAPGCMSVLAAGKKATRNKRVFLVDYQVPTDPLNQRIVASIHAGHLGEIAQVMTFGRCGGFPDPVRTENIESRLESLIWVNDIALGCDYIGNYDIHAIDAALWAIGQRPISAMGSSRICRPDPHGDAHDVCSVIYQYENGVVHNHFGEALNNNSHSKSLTCDVFGQKASAQIDYFGKSFIRGGPGHCSGKVEALYSGGAKRNIDKFHKNITGDHFENDTLQRSVDGVLTAILGKEAAARGTLLTMDQVIKENKECKPDLTGLKS